MVSALEVRRLALIRSLYLGAVAQSQRSGPRAGFCVLTFHDAVELFLELTAEHVAAAKRGMQFLEYWPAIGGTVALTRQTEMAKLNQARVGLKHYGNVPSPIDIEGFRVSVTAFFEENSPLVFAVDFKALRLGDLIGSVEVAAAVKRAEAARDAGDLQRAATEVAIGLRIALDENEERRGLGHLQRGSVWRRRPSDEMRLRGVPALPGLDEAAERIYDEIDGVRDTVRILANGVDYAGYLRFMRLTPYVHRSLGGPYGAICAEGYSIALPDLEFCLEFVVETTLDLESRA